MNEFEVTYSREMQRLELKRQDEIKNALLAADINADKERRRGQGGLPGNVLPEDEARLCNQFLNFMQKHDFVGAIRLQISPRITERVVTETGLIFKKSHAKDVIVRDSTFTMGYNIGYMKNDNRNEPQSYTQVFLCTDGSLRTRTPSSDWPTKYSDSSERWDDWMYAFPDLSLSGQTFYPGTLSIYRESSLLDHRNSGTPIYSHSDKIVRKDMTLAQRFGEIVQSVAHKDA